MNHAKFMFAWIAGTTLGLALVLGGCEKKSEEPVPPPATSQAPMPDQPSTSQAPNPDTGMGSVPGQKPEESKQPQKG
jgi:hypothetical protein